jgi:hypothetical protein
MVADRCRLVKGKADDEGRLVGTGTPLTGAG